jgi:hypothetical protein
MPQYYKLIKTLDAGTTYRAETDKFLIINRVSTNTSTAVGELTVAGAKCLEIHSDVAPIAMLSNNWIEMLELGDYFVVVPPAKGFLFSGDTNAKLHIQGTIGEMMTPADFPADAGARVGVQAKQFIKIQRGTASLAAAGQNWAANAENNVITLTATAGERHLIDSRLAVYMANLANLHKAGDIALRLYYQDKPLDILDSTMADLGLDIWEAYWNDGSSVYYKYYIDLSDMPIQLEPGRTLKVNVRNVSGGNITAAGGGALTCTVTLVDKYTMLP